MATAVAWPDLTATFIRSWIQPRFEMPALATATKDAMVAYLQNFGFSPADLLGRSPILPGPIIRVPPPVKELKPPSQAVGEPLEDYLLSLEAFFILEAIPEDKKVALLLSHILAPLRAAITAAITAGTTQFPGIKATLLQQYGPTPLQSLGAFHKACHKPATLTWTDHALQLVPLYLGYIGTWPGICTQTLTAIAHKRIAEHLLTSCPSFSRDSLAAYLHANPRASPVDIGRHLDIWDAQHKPSSNQPSAHKGHVCSIHGPGHSNAACFRQRPPAHNHPSQRQAGNARGASS